MQLSNLSLEYDPYPVGLIAPIFEDDIYQQLLATFPPLELFKFMPRFGNKYSLSEKNNPKQYAAYIAAHPAWRQLHAYVKSDDFIYGVIDALRDHKIDLGIVRRQQTLLWRWRRLCKNVLRGHMPSTPGPLHSRFEFSVLPAAAGVVVPHTDAPRKFVTLVISMTDGTDWNAAWGGGTDILAPNDSSDSFNYFNRSLTYDQCKVLRTVEFQPNQGMLFVKTFNSLHGVRSMTGPEGVLRRTLTINIERDY